MKKTACRLGGLAAALILAMTLLVPGACAAETASYYFAGTDAVIFADPGGEIYIEGASLATHTMEELGIDSITIYEQQDDGLYDPVYTYTRYNTAGMIEYNEYVFFKSVTYQGTVGKKYYACIGFYAKDDEGSEILYHDSNVVTAVQN